MPGHPLDHATNRILYVFEPLLVATSNYFANLCFSSQISDPWQDSVGGWEHLGCRPPFSRTMAHRGRTARQCPNQNPSAMMELLLMSIHYSHSIRAGEGGKAGPYCVNLREEVSWLAHHVSLGWFSLVGPFLLPFPRVPGPPPPAASFLRKRLFLGGGGRGDGGRWEGGGRGGSVERSEWKSLLHCWSKGFLSLTSAVCKPQADLFNKMLSYFLTHHRLVGFSTTWHVFARRPSTLGLWSV